MVSKRAHLFELSWPLNDQFGNLSGIAIQDADGRVLDQSWRQYSMAYLGATTRVGYHYQFEQQTKPARIRITIAEHHVNGQWVIHLPSVQ